MKVFITGLTAIITGLFLILGTSCQQTNKGDGKSHWQLSAPPGVAAGYGSAPLETSATKETIPAAPAEEQTQLEAAATEEEPMLQQPTTKDDGPSSSSPSLQIAPPPSAAGYGSSPLDTQEIQETSTVHQTNKSGQGEETAPAASEPKPRQPATGTSPPTSSWKIEPPPSAAGYGR
jgi:hypothetical protein